ncbi:MAG: type II CAAX endopeptidase family protein [Anaerolineales bacterium]
MNRFFRWVFISPAEMRLRAGWRLVLQSLLMLVIGVLVGAPAGLAALAIGLDTADLLFGQVIQFIVVTGSIFLAVRWLDRRPIAAIGLKLGRRAGVDLVAGIVISFLMMGLIYALMAALGWLTLKGFAWQVEEPFFVASSVLYILVVFLFVGWSEELLSRGYHLQTLASGLNLFWGVLLSSAVFGLLHLGNPNATWVSVAGIFLAGLFLAYGYLATRQLWLPIGLHIGWNFFEGTVFGFPVSGLDIYRLTRLTVNGPALWTGGSFGPEAGLIVLPGLLLGSALIFLYTKFLRSTHLSWFSP